MPNRVRRVERSKVEVAQPVAGTVVGGASEHRTGLLPEKNFRWRAGEITRLEAFCDVVFGFALTLLVISLEVPHSYDALMVDMRGLLPFAVCFWQLVAIWRMHYIFSRRYGLEDSFSVFLNTVLLFLVLFFVYPLKFVFSLFFSRLTGGEMDVSWHESLVLVQLYFVGFTALYLVFTLLYARAYKLRSALELNAVEARMTLDSLQLNASFAACGLLSFGLAFKNPFWVVIPGCSLGVIQAVHNHRAKRRIQRLLAAG